MYDLACAVLCAHTRVRACVRACVRDLKENFADAATVSS